MKKLCRACNIEKDLSKMRKDKKFKDGYAFLCKDCKNKDKKRNNPLNGESRICYGCGILKSFEEFSKNKNLLLGVERRCKSCKNLYKSKNKKRDDLKAKERKERRKNDLVYKENLNKKKRENRIINIETAMILNSKHRALRKGLEFNLVKEDILIPKFCPILNIPIKPGTKYNYGNSPSIDRIDNSKGYIKDNIQIISNKANTMKSSASPEELILFAEWVLRTFKKES